MKLKIFGSLIVLEAPYNKYFERKFRDTEMRIVNKDTFIPVFLISVIHYLAYEKRSKAGS